ncbi:MAG: T9SS type A sorting domain-containing protein, partial [Bacteroidota bacterium]
DIKIIPNPNTGSFQLELHGVPRPKVELSLWSLEGKLIMDGGAHYFNSGFFSKPMMFGSIPEGIYFLKIVSLNEETIYKKIIIQN